MSDPESTDRQDEPTLLPLEVAPREALRVYGARVLGLLAVQALVLVTMYFLWAIISLTAERGVVSIALLIFGAALGYLFRMLRDKPRRSHGSRAPWWMRLATAAIGPTTTSDKGFRT